MKLIVAAVFALVAFSAFSADLTSTVRSIEESNNAKCDRTFKGPRKCVGLSANIPMGPEFARERREAQENQICTYKVKLTCESNSGRFSKELQVRESRRVEHVTELN